MVDDTDRLRVVHEDEVVRLDVDLARVQLLEARENSSRCSAVEPLRVSLQRVVDRLRRGEERVAALDDAPLDGEARVLHQRDERVLDLGDTAAERRGRELEHPRAAERGGEREDLVHEAAGRDGRVVRK